MGKPWEHQGNIMLTSWEHLRIWRLIRWDHLNGGFPAIYGVVMGDMYVYIYYMQKHMSAWDCNGKYITHSQEHDEWDRYDQ